MPFNYNKLWKLLIDKNIKKSQLREIARIGTTTLAKMGKNENVSLDVLEKICAALTCQPGDIMEYVEDREKE